ncbi:putative membrane protein [Nocardioides luteus]|uniref:DUF2269 domain-containing protein n=1 Tax=Nocardioides luteus TaxID=1844 RepID=A0ABQ5SRZ3_9ACTN|nr:DUF2269 family protein [Nocardioides luteus]MDR7312925.1 putative membrane protein [Nocardioides luteus]GGR45319.1 hypothetical protein GCM10010197_08740 [Nocardioides luteus]GLJ65986.1 hypothetical protein GCM10017579_00220 [Nocardioides luteus]
MTGFLLAVHVVAAILAIGPVAVTASMFPPAARSAIADPGSALKAGTVTVLARITRVYSVIAVVVPVFGLATGASLGVLTDGWLIASMILTAIAAVLLVGAILPVQRNIVDALGRHEPAGADTSRRLAMYAGIFNLLWAVVVVLMIYRPGSTTGV